MRRSYWMVLMTLVCLFWIVVCSAEEKKTDWVDTSYDFKQLKTVIVQYSIDDKIKLTEVEKQNLDDLLKDKFFQAKKGDTIKYISMEQVEEAIEKSTGLNMKELLKTDNLQYKETLQKNLPTVADAVLKITITSHETYISHIPDTTQRYVEYEQHTSWESRYDYQGHYIGQQPVYSSRPVYKDRTIPGHDMQAGRVGANFSLLTTNSQQEVLRWEDFRGDASPEEVIGKLFNRAKEKIVKLTKSKK